MRGSLKHENRLKTWLEMSPTPNSFNFAFLGWNLGVYSEIFIEYVLYKASKMLRRLFLRTF